MRATRYEPACPDWDGEDDRWCDGCKRRTTHTIARWGFYANLECQECDEESEVDTRDEYDGPDDDVQDRIEHG